MSKETETNSTPAPPQLLFLDPSQIELDETVNVRPYTTAHTQSDASGLDFQSLIESIERNGQEQPVIVRSHPKYPSRYLLVAGNRRTQAVTVINAGRAEEEQIKVQAVLLAGGVDPFRVAFDENDKRAAMSPMDKALNFKAYRERNKLTGKGADAKVAAEFGVSTATVIQHRKLEKLDEKTQEMVGTGALTMDAALIAAKVGEELGAEKQAEVVQKAAEIEKGKQEKAAEGKVVITSATGRPGVPPGDPRAAGAGQTGKSKTVKASTKTRQAKGGKGAVSAASMKAAARDAGLKVSRNRKVILEWWEGQDGPAYKEQVREFVGYFLQWADGKGTDKTLGVKFDAMVGEKGMSSAADVVRANKEAESKPAPKKKAAKKKK